MGHVWIFQPYNNPNTNLKNNTKMGHWAQNQASEGSGEILDESEGSGEILDEGMVSDLLSGVL